MAVKQISVYAENKKGSLVKATSAIAAAGVDIKSLVVADTEDFGIIRILTSDPDTAVTALKNVGFTVSVRPVAACAIPNQAGELNRVLQALTDAGISIEYMYSIVGNSADKACMAIRVDNRDKAEAIFAEKGYQILTEADI